jgi:hypothetical protein
MIREAFDAIISMIKNLIEIMGQGFEYPEVLTPRRADPVYGFVIPELQLRGDEGSFLLVEKVSKFEKYVRHCRRWNNDMGLQMASCVLGILRLGDGPGAIAKRHR